MSSCDNPPHLLLSNKDNTHCFWQLHGQGKAWWTLKTKNDQECWGLKEGKVQNPLLVPTTQNLTLAAVSSKRIATISLTFSLDSLHLIYWKQHHWEVVAYTETSISGHSWALCLYLSLLKVIFGCELRIVCCFLRQQALTVDHSDL